MLNLRKAFHSEKSRLLGYMKGMCCVWLLCGCGITTLPEEEIEPTASARFRAEGMTLIMRGTIDDTTSKRLQKVLDENPGISTLVLDQVPGGTEFRHVTAVGRLVRQRRIQTRIPQQGIVLMGGLDVFLAGTQRSITLGARVGIFAWQSNDSEGNPIDASSLPRTHPLHRPYLDYYQSIGVDPDFYWFVLKKGEDGELYWLSLEERKRFGLEETTTP